MITLTDSAAESLATHKGDLYLDGLSGLFVVQAGHGRRELAEASARQASQLAYFPLWSYAHPNAIELSERLAALAPGLRAARIAPISALRFE